MNFLLTTFCLTSILHLVYSAPAVSSVHVSFVSGNKATEYSHGIGGSSPLSHYNLNAHSDEGENIHEKRKRSILAAAHIRHTRTSTTTTNKPTQTIGTTPAPTIPKLHKRKLTTQASNDAAKFSRKFYTKTTTTVRADGTTISPTLATPTTSTSATTSHSPSPLGKRMLGQSVVFVDSQPRPTQSADHGKIRVSKSSLLSGLSTPTSDLLKGESKNAKDSKIKAVKRSPFLGENFDAGGITFPDFDEFGGDEFGSLRNFADSRGHGGGGAGGGRAIIGAHTHPNPEALSPDGVFLPPLPTEASPDYADSDPYLSDPDTAKYAAQHPPFFAAFPHKRSVLALNEERVHNGLEPNILRSIRPYFAFFEAANQQYHEPQHEHEHGHLDFHTHYQPPHTPYRGSQPHPPPLSYSHSHSGYNDFDDLFNNLEPNHLAYAETQTHPTVSSWSIFKRK